MSASSDRPGAGVRRDRSLQTRRTIAKAGMLAAMGVLVWSAMASRRILRQYHPVAGVALLGFTVWHMGLYRRGTARAAGVGFDAAKKTRLPRP